MKQEIIDSGNEWFDVIKLPGNVYAIVEEGHIQNVRSFLIIGSKNALLFDTGMGIGNIKEVLYTPGHSEDSIMLLDRGNRILFTGDTFSEWMIAFFDSQMYGFGLSNIKNYTKSMKEISRYVADLEYLYPSHGKPLSSPEVLIKAARAFENVISGKAGGSI
ncbi:MAG: hypothetical protein DRZ90_11210 [Spirochaetes bacterium]|nr:MAG: hypothetical protein DRZ90_11210 [Spirochaetota bacterium]